jgi:hypothetical protein
MGQLKVAPASTTRIERRTLATYKDFGHLKVGPAGEVASILNSYASASNHGRSNSLWAALVFLNNQKELG